MYTQTTFFVVALLIGAVYCAPEERVVNGTDSHIEKYPFMVSLRYANGTHRCGSTIVAPRWVLTAAHCVRERAPEFVTLQYASTKTDVNSSNVVAVKRFILHEEYDCEDNQRNDIALVELNGELVYNYKTIAPINLPKQGYEVSQSKYGSPGVLIGWGMNVTAGKHQTTLQEVNLKIYSDEECNQRHNGVTTKDQICGGVDEGGKGQCSGDSGGPLLLNGVLQVGITSWSIKPCTVYPYPGVYTKVSHYVDWIRKHIN